MARWLIYFKERFPLPVYLLLVGGFSFSGTWLAGPPWRWGALVYSFVGILVFFALLRLMDELKDYEKDLSAHPERPLPRGLLSVEEVTQAVNATAVAMIAYGTFGAVFLNAVAGINYIVLTGYLWLMYREFYVGHWLEERQMIYATTHQFVLVLLATFAVFSSNPALLFDPQPYLFSCLVVGSFFSYEICRKLDPHSAPILRQYRYLYGAVKCFALVLVLSAMAGWAAWELNVTTLAWPAGALLILSYVFFVRNKHKVVEGVASLSLALHLWAITLTGVLFR